MSRPKQSTDTRPEIPNRRLIAAIREAEEDYRLGRTFSFDNAKDAIAFLDKIKTKKIRNKIFKK